MYGKCSVNAHNDLNRLEDNIPKNQPRTQAHSAPKYHLSRTACLSRPLEFLISASDIGLHGAGIRDQLTDIVFLGGQMGDEGLLERSDV